MDIDLTPLRGFNPTATNTPYTDLCYIYQLTWPDGKPFYVGSSVNPTSRLLCHINGQCKDTAPTVSYMASMGDVPVMRVVDVTDRRHRLYLEARHINETHGTVNSVRYHTHYARWLGCPQCFRAASTGTLALAQKSN